MPVVDRAALEDSPLADLHELASELGIDGFRRLRKANLIDAILEQQGGDGAAAAPEAEEAEATDEPEAEAEEKPKRSRRGGRSRRKDPEDEAPAKEPKEAKEAKEAKEPAAEKRAPREERVAEGVVELLGNGSGFVRVDPPEPSDDDVYVSAAQVRRCEL